MANGERVAKQHRDILRIMFPSQLKSLISLSVPAKSLQSYTSAALGNYTIEPTRYCRIEILQRAGVLLILQVNEPSV